jgi:ketosteroid isomerase-like protein
MDGEAIVRAYYRAIDDHDYEAFADRLAPDVVHRRPDRTIDGRETLVAFMRDDRPDTETSHELRHVYDGDADAVDGDGAVVVEGCLLDSAGNELFTFADAFSLSDGRIAEIRTYTR